MQNIKVTSIGKFAWEMFQITGALSILGVTSKGIFLKHPRNQVIFISKEKYLGPYSITVKNPGVLPMDDQFTASINSGRMYLGSQVMIDSQDMIPWTTPLLDKEISLSPLYTTADMIGRIAADEQKTDYPICLLSEFCNKTNQVQVEDRRWLAVKQVLNHPEINNLQSALEGVVGYGRGLTPSGDDFILGILFGAGRYSEKWNLPEGFASGMKQLITTAQTTTTLISSNLIMAANQGDVDERLATAFDGYMHNSMDGKSIYDILQTWGNSSGLDAFTGLVWLNSYLEQF